MGLGLAVYQLVIAFRTSIGDFEYEDYADSSDF